LRIDLLEEVEFKTTDDITRCEDEWVRGMKPPLNKALKVKKIESESEEDEEPKPPNT